MRPWLRWAVVLAFGFGLAQAAVAAPAAAAAHGAWIQTGLVGDSIGALGFSESNPSRLYAGTITQERGVFASSNDGQSWAPFNNGLGDLDVDGLAVAVEIPNLVYAISSSGKHLWRSDDGGLIWRNRVLPGDCAAEQVAVDPGDGNRVYVSTCKGVQRSDDGGITWKTVGPTVNKAIVFTIMRSAPQHLYFADGKQLYRSGNRGDGIENLPSLVDNEQQVGLEYEVTALAPHTQDSRVLYAVTKENGLFRSIDRGRTWTPRNHQLPNQGHGLSIPSLAVDPFNGDSIFVYTFRSTDIAIEPLFPGEKGLFHSNDGGETWTDITADFDTTIDVLSLRVLPDRSGTPVIGTADGVWQWLPTAIPDGSLVSASGANIYLIRGGERLLIPDLDTFTACGFSFDSVQDVPDWYLRWVYDGAGIRNCGAPDYPVAGGHFYTQNGGGRGRGYAVSDADGAPFLTEYLARGGPQALGYPLTRRFTDGLSIAQAFDNYVLRWDPATNQMSLANTLDDLADAGLDAWLLANHALPQLREWSQDTGQPWDKILQNHLALLTGVNELADSFRARDYLAFDGLPMAVSATAAKQVLRAQRTALVWTPEDGVSVLYGATLAKAAGLFPADALQPEDRR